MSYKVQNNLDAVRTLDVIEGVDTVGLHRRPPDEGWETICPIGSSPQEFVELDQAVRVFELNASLARMIWPMRLIHESGCILRYYNPELDERLPGCFWRLNQRAYSLWEAAGSPPSDGKEFWYEAKKLIERETSHLGRFFENVEFSSEGDLLLNPSPRLEEEPQSSTTAQIEMYDPDDFRTVN